MYLKKIALGSSILLSFVFCTDAHAFGVGCSDGGGGKDVKWGNTAVGEQAWQWDYSNNQNDDPSPLVEVWLSPNAGGNGQYWLLQYPGGGNSYNGGGQLDDYDESSYDHLVARVECDGTVTNTNDFGGNFNGYKRVVRHNGSNVSSGGVIVSGQSVTVSWNYAFAWESWVNGPNGTVYKSNNATGNGSSNYTWNSGNFVGTAAFDTCVRGPANGTLCETVYVQVDQAPLGSLAVTSNVATSWTINHSVGNGSGTSGYYPNLQFFNNYTISNIVDPPNYDCEPDEYIKQINAGNPDKTFAITCTQTSTVPIPDLLCFQGGSYVNGPCTTTGAVSLQWTSTNSPTSCTASAVSADAALWSGGKAGAGTQGATALPAGTTRTYTLTCSNGAGTASDSVIVSYAGPPAGTIAAINGPRNSVLGSGPTPGTVSGTISGGSGSGYAVQIVIRRGSGLLCNDWNGTAWTSGSCIAVPANVAGNTWSVSGAALPPVGSMTSGETYRVWANFGDGAGAWSAWTNFTPLILFDNTPPTGTVTALTSSGGQITSAGCPPGSPFPCAPGTVTGTFLDPISGTNSTGQPLVASGVISTGGVVRRSGAGCAPPGTADWTGSSWNTALCVVTAPNPVLNPVGGTSGTWTLSGSAIPPAASMTADNYWVWFQSADAAGNTAAWQSAGPLAFQPDRVPDGTLDVVNDTGGGTAQGWSVDKDTPSQNVNVHFYVNGPYDGTATYFAGVTLANLLRPDVSAWCAAQVPSISCPNPGFAWAIPSLYRDGASHQIWAYGINTSGGSNPMLFGSPKSFLFPAPTVSNVGYTPPADFCSSGSSGPSATVHWDYFDTPLGAKPQSKYQVQIDDSPAFGSLAWDSGQVLGSEEEKTCPSASCNMLWNTTYWARVMVWDGDGNASVWSTPTSWTTPMHQYPSFVDTFSWEPLPAEAGKLTTFNPGTSSCYDVGGQAPCPLGGYAWDFGDGTGSGGSNPSHTYSELASHVVTLTVTDSDGFACSAQKPLTVEKAIPRWREVLPR